MLANHDRALPMSTPYLCREVRARSFIFRHLQSIPLNQQC
jgi:hypothetical protein